LFHRRTTFVSLGLDKDRGLQ